MKPAPTAMPLKGLCSSLINSLIVAAAASTLLILVPSSAGVSKQIEKGALNPTGKYDKENGLHSGLLWVQDMKGKTGETIKFHLFAQYNSDPNAPNIGEVVGTAAIKNNHAVYDSGEKMDHLKMTFDFSQEKVTIGCKEPEKFGGAHVNPTGIYKLVSHQRPKASDMKYEDQ